MNFALGSSLLVCLTICKSWAVTVLLGKGKMSMGLVEREIMLRSAWVERNVFEGKTKYCNKLAIR